MELHVKDGADSTTHQPPSSASPTPQHMSISNISGRRSSIGLNRDSPSAAVKTTVASRSSIMGELLLKSDVELIFASPVKEIRNDSIAEPCQPVEEDFNHHESHSPHCPASTATRSSTSHIRDRTDCITVSNPPPQSDAFSLEDIAEGRVDLLMSPPSHVNHHRDSRPLEDVCHKSTSPPRPHPSARHQYLEEEY